MSYQNQNQTQNQLSNLVGNEIKINRGGPDSVTGVVLAIQSDFLVVRTKDGVVYIHSSHIKSMSELESNRSNRSGMNTKFVSANSFNNLLQKLRHQFVQINRGGPEKIEGFIAEVTQDYLLLLVNREMVRVPIFHIKTVNVIAKNSNKDSKNSNGSSSSGSKGNSNKNANNTNTNKTSGTQNKTSGTQNKSNKKS